MISVGTIYSYSFRSSECDNYYHNKPFKILKYIVLWPLGFTSSKLLISSFSSVEI